MKSLSSSDVELPGTPEHDGQALDAATRRLDQLLHNQISRLTGGLSPVSQALAWADWGWHLALSPGRLLELAALASQLATQVWLSSATEQGLTEAPAGDDPRFRHPAWGQWPFHVLRAGFRQSEAFWREAANVPGMTAHHQRMIQFYTRQWLGMLAPANWLPTNPVVLQDVVDSGGAHLLQGAANWLEDLGSWPQLRPGAHPSRFRVGRDVAITPGQVVMRNRLVELIRYDAQTERVHPEPVLIVPSWIMKYYILDLSPHNSLVRYLVQQGHTVYMLSWRNPDTSDRDLTMDDYLTLGIGAALDCVRELSTASGKHARTAAGLQPAVHAVGYCLGGTLLAIAAAALGRVGHGICNGKVSLKSLTMLAAQTDFSEPGELGLFVDESQIHFLDDVTREAGYLSGQQMAATFEFLHSRELVWTRRMHEYLMGEREKPNDLMAWNADTTRMPARMHQEYLNALYLHNNLARHSYQVQSKSVSLADIHLPVFMVSTERDHVSPWHSVYKLHALCDAEITFVLASGGHNAGIVSEPGHAQRHYRIHTRTARAAPLSPDQWWRQASTHEGSWWPAWCGWLAQRSSTPQRAQDVPTQRVLGPAPGTYVHQAYPEDRR